ncbi:cytochrome c oxidase subunit 7A-related protein, mitochondrial-like [Xenia sp. Carnegie-2017]|uniref:cytochrome c oxidase subunit 7A-related protein, mitochondrial-like n=1 Tax=Xenia sp. Carnegie-2017 TaxID=2897299 RepID=UPI001F0495F6|nr:cytochrome c oxidase subunit 7A-related protein, mitochondrial-like [Xenia sp. Carnegie-2017]
MDAVRRLYKRRIEQDVNSVGLSVDRPNRVSYYQSFFQRSSGLPVYLKGPNDQLIYRSCMIASAAGIGICLASIYLMATGLKKK